jgi:hypothetical protein
MSEQADEVLGAGCSLLFSCNSSAKLLSETEVLLGKLASWCLSVGMAAGNIELS